MDRAIEIFSSHLAENDGSLGPAFPALLDAHADLRPELEQLQRGLKTFRRILPQIREVVRQDQRERTLRRVAAWTGAAAAAAVLIAMTWRTITLESGRRAAATIADRSAAILATALESGTGAENAAINGQHLRAAKSESHNVRGPSLQAMHAQEVASLYSAVRDIAIEQGDEDPIRSLRVSLATAQSRLAKADDWRKDAVGLIDGDLPIGKPSGPLLLSMHLDPVIRSVVRTAVRYSKPESEAFALAERIEQRATLRLRAIDLDADGTELVGAKIYGQQVDLPSDQFQKPVELGTTPLGLTFLAPGDWRITVVHSKDGLTRHSQQRLLAIPGGDLGLRVAFLRKTSDVIQGMANEPECLSRFGGRLGGPPVNSDLPVLEYTQSQFWIDRYEVTCEEYSKFFLDLKSHPSWFDGALPVGRPRVLREDGTCPDEMKLRPIVDVTWDEAVLFANWAGKRLPTEREWERTARGDATQNRVFPWGNLWEESRVNVSASMILNSDNLGRLLDLDYESLSGANAIDPDYDTGGTPEGAGDRVFRMADNVSEFTENLFTYVDDNGKPYLPTKILLSRTMRGGSWLLLDQSQARTCARTDIFTTAGTAFVGIRCVKTDMPRFDDP